MFVGRVGGVYPDQRLPQLPGGGAGGETGAEGEGARADKVAYQILQKYIFTIERYFTLTTVVTPFGKK